MKIKLLITDSRHGGDAKLEQPSVGKTNAMCIESRLIFNLLLFPSLISLLLLQPSPRQAKNAAVPQGLLSGHLWGLAFFSQIFQVLETEVVTLGAESEMQLVASFPLGQ